MRYGGHLKEAHIHVLTIVVDSMSTRSARYIPGPVFQFLGANDGKILILQQLPVSLEWTSGPGGSVNVNYEALIASIGGTDVLLDIIILSTPIPMIRRLQMPLRKKVLTGCMFGLGAL